MSSSFTFDQIVLNPKTGEIHFLYILTKDTVTHRFDEKMSFPLSEKLNETDPLVQKILQSVHVALGMSYWKLYCPTEISFSSYQLSKTEADFWNTIYTKGMGEFYFKNSLDYRNLMHFPFDESIQNGQTDCKLKDRSLVGMGGGKDSIVSARLLQNASKSFDGFIVETQKKYSVVSGVSEELNVKTITVDRFIDPQLFEVNNRADVYNGHVPISVIYAFLGVLCAYLYDYRNVIVSNERSSDYGNIEYLGEMINHQWSKSSEFEQLFQKFISQTLTPEIHYFSLLRPLSELQIAQIFSKEKRFHQIFSSCNRNFAIHNPGSHLWCGTCPKCAFTFILMAAYSSKGEVLNIFGDNFLDKKELFPLYKQLFGTEGHKPFECVGTPAEAVVAMTLIHEKQEFEDSLVMKEFVQNILPDNDSVNKLKYDVLVFKSRHMIPDEFQSIIPNSLL
ncbi:hypothetical protein COY16_01810 [Candidatus Roizmanbacteria bacterium CG_4_10_14_0_2_um_filter_39_13]|uniref:UDP-N-acetyl-alpha-D-muramoyl-L-alanyl-L-glutamate epimerase n=1 Tax=Candidatus Roizmanbacteria bacterium CG_4_10_14_0_2_um_filter_39_13 TaxID=1974825 RepID=A0A2M7U0F6_9BACT|nr:MAG: hypothetical protein COY16_01810 [Candidatus Roizmanbacteria bacterium CG_4_10_14_0_2_um_filter_39_13]